MSSTTNRTSRKGPRRAGLAVAVAAAAGVVGIGAPAHASVSAPYGGLGSASVQCSQIGHNIRVQVTQQQQSGRLGQTLWTDISIYSYAANRTWVVRSGYHDQLASSGLGYTSYNSPVLPAGRYAVKVTYWWYTTAGWISGSEWQALYRQQTPYYVYGGGFDSYSCYA